MKENIIKLLEDQTFTYRKIDELAQYFEMTSTEDYIQFIKLMNQLENDGLIIRNKMNEYYLINQLQFYSGIIEMNKRGFG